MKKKIFTGSGTAIITPFTDDGINFDAMGKFIDFQIENKSDAIIVCGTTGESATMSEKEHSEAVSFAVKHVAGRVPVIAGTGSNNTRTALKLSEEAQKDGADALLIVTPYYNKTTQDGLVKHYNFIADNVDLPIVIYNVPSRTGLNILPQTYLELSKHKNIAAIKEANGDVSAIAQTMALVGDNLTLYSGNDDQNIPLMSLGSQGIISVFGNICPKVSHDICELYLSGKTKEALALNLEYLDLMNIIFSEVNPIPVKTAAGLMGFDVGPLRMPLCEMSSKNLETMKAIMKKHGLIK